MRGLLALALLAGLARAEEPPSVAAYQPPPKTALVVVWNYGDTATKVVVLSEEQAKKTAALVEYAERQAMPWWAWVGAGVILGSVAGAYAHAHLSK